MKFKEYENTYEKYAFNETMKRMKIVKGDYADLEEAIDNFNNTDDEYKKNGVIAYIITEIERSIKTVIVYSYKDICAIATKIEILLKNLPEYIEDFDAEKEDSASAKNYIMKCFKNDLRDRVDWETAEKRKLTYKRKMNYTDFLSKQDRNKIKQAIAQYYFRKEKEVTEFELKEMIKYNEELTDLEKETLLAYVEEVNNVGAQDGVQQRVANKLDIETRTVRYRLSRIKEKV